MKRCWRIQMPPAGPRRQKRTSRTNKDQRGPADQKGRKYNTAKNIYIKKNGGKEKGKKPPTTVNDICQPLRINNISPENNQALRPICIFITFTSHLDCIFIAFSFAFSPFYIIQCLTLPPLSLSLSLALPSP